MVFNSECFEIKVVHQRDTERAHHKGLHDKWGIEIIAQTAEFFFQAVLLSKSHVSKNCDTHKIVL